MKLYPASLVGMSVYPVFRVEKLELLLSKSKDFVLKVVRKDTSAYSERVDVWALCHNGDAGYILHFQKTLNELYRELKKKHDKDEAKSIAEEKLESIYEAAKAAGAIDGYLEDVLEFAWEE